MKHGKNPTRRQMKVLKSMRLIPQNWLIVKDCAERFEIVHRYTGTRRVKIKTRANSDL